MTFFFDDDQNTGDDMAAPAPAEGGDDAMPAAAPEGEGMPAEGGEAEAPAEGEGGM